MKHLIHITGDGASVCLLRNEYLEMLNVEGLHREKEINFKSRC